MKNFPTAALALTMLPCLCAAAGTRRKWAFAPFSTLLVTPAEPGAPANDQPLKVDPAVLAQALGSVSFAAKKTNEQLFAPAELTDLAAALSEALAVAGPGDDLELQSTRKRDKAIFSSSMAVTARVFVRDGKLNLIVHDARLDYHIEYNLENRMPKFEYGTRAAAGPEHLRAPGAELPRPDWVVLPLATAALAQAAPAAQVVAAPAPLARPRPVAAPETAAKPPTRSAEDRLRELKRLRDQDLITEEDYDKKKQEILKEFSKD